MLVDELGYDWCELSVQANCRNICENEHFKGFVAVNQDNDVIGMLCFLVYPDLWNVSNTTAHESFWYVLPEYRGLVGGKLIKYVENNIDCDIIELGMWNDRLVSLLQRKGYKSVKVIMQKEVQ